MSCKPITILTLSLPLSLFLNSHPAFAQAKHAEILTSYDSKKLDSERYEIDLIKACQGQESCQINYAPGQKLTISSSSTAKFNGLNTADGLVGEKGDNTTELPANGCLNVGTAHIRAFAWKASDGHQDVAPSGYDSSTGTYNKIESATKVGALYTFDGAFETMPSQICLQPPSKIKKKPSDIQFSFLWVRLENKAGENVVAPTVLSFSENMKRASSPLLTSVTRALGEVKALSDRDVLIEVLVNHEGDPNPAEDAKIKDIQTRLNLVKATLVAAQSVLDPRANIDPQTKESRGLLSVAHPQVRQALKAVQAAWGYVEPSLKPLEALPPVQITNKSDQDAISMAVPKNSFLRNIAWLRSDLESFQIYGDEQQTFPATAELAKIILGQMTKLRPQIIDKNKMGDDFRDTLDRVQGLLLDLRNTATAQGDASPVTAAAAAKLNAYWNGGEAQKMIAAGTQVTSMEDDIELLYGVLKAVVALPAGQGLTFKMPK